MKKLVILFFGLNLLDIKICISAKLLQINDATSNIKVVENLKLGPERKVIDLNLPLSKDLMSDISLPLPSKKIQALQKFWPKKLLQTQADLPSELPKRNMNNFNPQYNQENNFRYHHGMDQLNNEIMRREQIRRRNQAIKKK